MFGGEDIPITNLMPSDIEFRGNYCFKPLDWQGVWRVKNLFELKSAQRVLVSGNIFENCWTSGQDGSAIVFSPRNQYGSDPWCTVQDVTFENNKIINANRGINFLINDDLQETDTPANKILIRNNLFSSTGTMMRINRGITGNGPGSDVIVTRTIC